MKKIILFTMFFTVTLLSAQTKKNTIIGKWIGTDERKQTSGIEFNNTGKAKLFMFGKEMPECEYKVDYQKDPITVQLIVKRNGKTMIMYGLIKFINSDTVKWEVFPTSEKQPKTFSEKATGTSIILKRTK